MHAYHTKVPPAAIEPYLVEFTMPGATVIDPFCGSGMTGVAARNLGRHAILSDLSPAAVHIAANYTTPCDPVSYRRASDHVTSACNEISQALYGTGCHSCGGSAVTAYVIWSDVRRCPDCGAEIRLWDLRDAGLRTLSCKHCGASHSKKAYPLVGESAVRVSLDCVTCGRLERDPLIEDLELCRSRDEVPDWYPNLPFGPEREMWRRGHSDLHIQSVADFYSARNLWALSALWSHISEERDTRLRSALQFTFTAIANRASRRYQWNAKRPTNVLGGTLYVSSLRYEFNVFSLWSRKGKMVRKLFETTSRDVGTAEVRQGSALSLPYEDNSVDYCFTDPPFGANIVYSDCSLLWEAWLGDLTDSKQEAVVTSRRGEGNPGRTVEHYASMMAEAFAEIGRVLKHGAPATLVFQNTDPAVWSALKGALDSTDLIVVGATTLLKSQPSFKGVKAQQDGERVATSDVVLLLRNGGRQRARVKQESLWELVWRAIAKELDGGQPTSLRRRSISHLYGVAVSAALAGGLPTEAITFQAIAELLQEKGIAADAVTSRTSFNATT